MQATPRTSAYRTSVPRCTRRGRKASAIEALGNRVYNGEVWEWTATPAVEGGFVVCGGRWRNALDRPASAQNRSFETVAADDVGVRCVQDLRS